MNKNKIVLPKPTDQENYTKSLMSRQNVWWKRWLDVQRPYRWNINRLRPGFILDVGCGIGRNLLHLKSNGVGIDHNETSVNICRSRGLTAFTVDEWYSSSFNKPEHFDTILLAHVAEHMTGTEVTQLINQYLYLLKPGGQFIIITPQEKGFRSDDTHVEFMNFEKISNLLSQAGLQIIKQYSFPFPRFAGHFFKYNESINVALKQ